MKELSIEEKAKAYDEAIKKAKAMIPVAANQEEIYNSVITIFPELKESEDERIRKRIIHALHGDVLEMSEIKEAVDWLEKQGEQKPNPYSGTSFEYNGHTWGMCARDNGVEILIDGHLKGRVFANDSNAKEMFIKALERVKEQNSKGYKLTDCDKNSWWEDFKAYASCTVEQKSAETENGAKGNEREIPNSAWSEEDEMFVHGLIRGLAAMKNIHRHTTFSSDNIDITKTIDWLKSLKDRYVWKPSDEQMDALAWALSLAKNCGEENAFDLRTLYEQLKKLREE